MEPYEVELHALAGDLADVDRLDYDEAWHAHAASWAWCSSMLTTGANGLHISHVLQGECGWAIV
jgi:hypothetical protein